MIADFISINLPGGFLWKPWFFPSKTKLSSRMTLSRKNDVVFIKSFQQKKWKKISVQRLLNGFKKQGSMDRKPDPGRSWSRKILNDSIRKEQKDDWRYDVLAIHWHQPLWGEWQKEKINLILSFLIHKMLQSPFLWIFKCWN